MFSNIGSDANIDWATLAQQWIQRNTKGAINETLEAAQNSQNYYEKRARSSTNFDEKGEADMDMDDDECPPPPPSMMPMLPNIQFPMQSAIPSVDITNQRPDPTTWNTWMSPPNPILPQQFPKSNPTAHIPSLMKINVPNPNDLQKPEENSSENTSTTIDAAKRKVLPAWIREGLEKMEREKQKQLEREQQMRERGGEKNTAASGSVSLAADITVKDHVIKPLESGDSSGNEQEDDNLPTYRLKNINKSKYIDNVEAPAAASVAASNDDDDIAAPALFVSKSYEQRLADLMISVRQSLTELLLEVTNDEIAQIAKETLNSSKLKASSAQVIRKSALSSITNRLGLAAYSSSGDESDSDNSTPSDNEIARDDRRRRGRSSSAAGDSEEEIKTKLRARRRAFAKTTEEIEECIAMNAAREEQKLRYYKQKEQHQKQSNESDDEERDRDTITTATTSTSTSSGIGKNNARDFGETTTESKLQQSNGKKSKERSTRRGERTTRFSDNKDSKNVVAVTATYMSQINPPITATTAAPVATSTIHGFQVAATNSASPSDAHTNTHNLTTAAAVGINTMLSAAEAALEKATKSKSVKSSSTRSKCHDTRERDQRRRRHTHSHRHSSDDSDSSSTSNDSTDSSSSSDTSRDSKYSRASSTSTSRHKRSSHSSSRYHERSEDRRRHYHKRYRDNYDDRTRSRHSSSSKHSTRQRERERERSRDRSRSRSTYSSSSSKRNQNRH